MFDLEYLEQIAGHDKILLDNLLDQFLQSTKEDLVDLKAAVDEKDIAAIKELAHKIKGAAVTIGADELEALLAEMETSVDSSADFCQTLLEKLQQSFDSLSKEMNKL